MYLGRLDTIISQFEYNQLNLLENPTPIRIKINPNSKQAYFEQFYRHDKKPKQGTCSELMNTAFLELRDELYFYTIIRASGQESDFFKWDTSNHCFLLIYNSDPMKGESYTENQEEIMSALSKNPLLVDPSFKRVIPYNESGYTIRKMMNHDCNVSYSNDLILGEGQFVPLGTISNGGILYLTLNFGFESSIGVGVQFPKSPIFTYSLDHFFLGPLLRKDEGLEKLVSILRDTNLEETDESFTLSPNIKVYQKFVVNLDNSLPFS